MKGGGEHWEKLYKEIEVRESEGRHGCMDGISLFEMQRILMGLQPRCYGKCSDSIERIELACGLKA